MYVKNTIIAVAIAGLASKGLTAPIASVEPRSNTFCHPVLGVCGTYDETAKRDTPVEAGDLMRRSCLSVVGQCGWYGVPNVNSEDSSKREVDHTLIDEKLETEVTRWVRGMGDGFQINTRSEIEDQFNKWIEQSATLKSRSTEGDLEALIHQSAPLSTRSLKEDFQKWIDQSATLKARSLKDDMEKWIEQSATLKTRSTKEEDLEQLIQQSAPLKSRSTEGDLEALIQQSAPLHTRSIEEDMQKWIDIAGTLKARSLQDDFEKWIEVAGTL